MSLRAILVLLFALATALGVGVAATAVLSDHAQTRARAERQLRAAAVLVEEHAAGILHSADQLVGRAELLIGGRDMASLWDDRKMWEQLKAMADTLPYVVATLVVDPQGRTVLGTRVFPTQRTDVTDRDYFKAHAAGAPFYIGRTIFGRGAGQHVFTVSRRLSGPDGSFAGVIAVTLDAHYFAETYAKSGLTPTAVLAIMRTDGMVIVRHPLNEKTLEQSLAGQPLFATHLPKAREGAYSAPSPVDGMERLLAYRASERLPVVAVASLPMEDLYAPWHTRTAWTAALTAGALAAAGVLFALLLRGLGREARVRAELESANGRLDRTNRSLAEALAEKDVLFREVHHRVTNNLQVVSGLLNIQAAKTEDGDTRDALRTMLNRVDSMALLHRVLYRTNEAATLDFGPYLLELCGALSEAFALPDRGVALLVDAEPCVIDLDRAVPIALAVNEAITNAIKHAFPGGRQGTVTVRVRRQGPEAVVEVQDDGVGMQDTERRGPGIGKTLLRRLVEQARGRYDLLSGEGTVFRVSFPAGPEVPAEPAPALH